MSRQEPLPLELVNEALRDFKRVFHTQTPRNDLTGLWLKVLRGITPDQFRQACDEYLDSGKRFFPTPGVIRQQALTYRVEAQRSVKRGSFEQDYKNWCLTYDGRCPICGASWGPLGSANRNPKFQGTEWHGLLPPLTHGVVHLKADHDALGVPVLWRDAQGLTHDGFWT